MKRETALRHMNLCLDAAGLGSPDALEVLCVVLDGDLEAKELIGRAAQWAQIAEALR